MKRFVFSFIGALLLPVSAVYAQDDCTQVSSGLERLPCSESAKKSADTQLNVSYQQLMARIEAQYRVDPALGSSYAAKVKESQRAWLKLRDTGCALEAFEIEAGQPAYVATVNLCVARMSRERSAYLEKIAPEQVTPPTNKNAAAAPVNDVCPSEEFTPFLIAYSADSESQRRLTALTVKQLLLKPIAGKGPTDFEPVTTGVPGASLAYPLLAPVSPTGTLGVEIETVDDSHVNVVDKRAGNSNVKIFNFSRQACWVLEGVEDWSISEKDLVATRKPGMSRAENFCEQRAEALGGLGFLEQYRLTVELIEASLENYVCAAESGDPEASESAARLSLSQMASQLETSKVEALFKAASKTPSGALGYASFFCMGNSTNYDGPCLHPKQAEEQVIRAISMGSVDGMNYLASSFEAGDLGTKDVSRALACYQMAADKGDQAGARNVQRLTSQGAGTIKASHCI
ncbi:MULTISPECIES: lysozyme inhibitor LprI family protein [unclassified Pseudomonas]|uniref:lysozyme inhibitor LprI family protein n=1 Tax=unclassified Pseudomonas TaxID=196821 RepID=UPI000A1F14AC